MSAFLYERCCEAVQEIVTQITDMGFDPPGIAYVPVGAPAMDVDQYVDECCEGLITARPSRVYLTNPFPVEAPFTAGGCTDGLRAAEITVQVARCIPTVDSNGNAPDVAEKNAAGYQAAGWILAVHRGMACVVQMWNDSGWDSLVGSLAEDQEPTGGCASWTGLLTIDMEECPCPTCA